MTGPTKSLKVIPVADAVEIARRQRQELVAGAAELAKIVPADASDAAYVALQRDLESVAPTLSDISWAHKYWFSPNRTGSTVSTAPTYNRDE